MCHREPDLQLVLRGAQHTLMYLVLETDTLPWIAESLYDLLEKVDDLESTDCSVLTPDWPPARVKVQCVNDVYSAFEVTLINLDGSPGRLVERVEYDGSIGADDQPLEIKRYQRAHGWDLAAYED